MDLLKEGEKYLTRGQAASALPSFQSALKICRSTSNPMLAATLQWVGRAHHVMGEYDAAMKMYKESLPLTKAAANSPEVSANLYNMMADVHMRQNRPMEAEKCHKAAFNLRRKDGGGSHSSEVLVDRAMLHAGKQQHGKALKCFQQALDLETAALGREHPDVACTLGNMAHMNWKMGRMDEALRNSKEALRIRKAAFGESHNKVADSYNNLGAMLQAKGGTKEAMHCFEQALAIKMRALGAHHIDVANTMHNMGVVCFSSHELAKARHLFEQAAELRRRILGPSHPSTLNSVASLKLITKAQKRKRRR